MQRLKEEDFMTKTLLELLWFLFFATSLNNFTNERTKKNT